MTIWTIAKTTVGEAMRKKVLNVCLIVAIAMLGASVLVSMFTFRQDMTTLKGIGLFVILLAGFVISILMCISLIPNEVERRTIYTILAKPVNRYEFVVGKFLGGLATLAINIGIMGAIFVLVVTIKAALSTDVQTTAGGVGVAVGEVSRKVQAFDPQLLLGVIMIYFQFMVLSAIVMFFSVFLTPTVNFFASTGVYIVGSLAGIWQGLYLVKLEGLGPVVKWAYKIISNIPPNFDLFNMQNRLIHPVPVQAGDPVYYIGISIAYAILYSLVVMIAAVILFDRKEV